MLQSFRPTADINSLTYILLKKECSFIRNLAAIFATVLQEEAAGILQRHINLYIFLKRLNFTRGSFNLSRVLIYVSSLANVCLTP